jgi:hypothetical protein
MLFKKIITVYLKNHKTHIHGELSQLVTVTMLQVEWTTNHGSIPVGGKCVLYFAQSPDGLWGPLNLPSNGYRGLFIPLGVKGPGRDCDGWLPYRMVEISLTHLSIDMPWSLNMQGEQCYFHIHVTMEVLTLIIMTLFKYPFTFILGECILLRM